ncbi:hypothetical protein EDC04DRAFT_2573072 [Pisolithus marmoratus]|nr:hypothetical protein EDC04DRAFT_2573072 [Pisolithus marmoratus]
MHGPYHTTDPAHLDFTFIHTSDPNPCTDGTCLEALLVWNLTPLAYIEWFMPFHSHEPASDMYIISCSTHMQCCFTEIIPVECIIHSCHLIPDFGKEKDSRWMAANVGLVCDQFFVNPYINYHTFCLMKLGHRNCI